MSSPQAPEQPKSIPHHEWDLHGHSEPAEQPSEIDYATDAYEAARRIIEEARPAVPSAADADAEYERLDKQGGHFRAVDIRRKAGIPEDPKS